ncbi:MAG TPA: glycoside hydrolase family 2 TIM barrel-domain containing protein [Prolixibacteraceae bacterium]|nr:glycoside hydrolase family 2 TIM barrel-domain containing protein [Prolixibacteraceae bacterium]
MNRIVIILLSALLFSISSAYAQKTEIKYLSGTGSDSTVEWDFFCTAGRNSGKWTKIAVPSNWELQGFGTYNYGGDRDEDRGKETGMYKYKFQVPKEWKNKQVNIVFDGSMTDTRVKINGVEAGKMHQGSFYRFKYDISRLLKYGRENLLEVSVAKHSANEGVNEAERRCDFWIFGGIFRPVFLEALPMAHIERIALDAKADGSFKVDVFLNNINKSMEVKAQVKDLDGSPVGSPFTVSADPSSSVVHLETAIRDIKLWSPEFPNRYKVDVQLTEGKVVHEVTEKFGFRTVELRESDGIYVNGVKVMFKGVCRHSFRPATGRTLSKQISNEDVNTIKDMNMNSVRMSHYPPDVHFLDVCDSLGLFVLDELAGWQSAYDTPVGSLLAQEMLHLDVNHPSIVVWDNGNEGGWNKELDHFFDELDPQKRPLIHPWAEFRGTDTQHYKDYNYGTGTHQHGRNIVFPTEFLHGLYDGGHGAGLDDYWNLMLSNPLSAGGFLWDYADEAVVRTDKNGILDTRGNLAADGIVGPYLEKEGSYYTIREIWSPVFIEKRYITPGFNGEFTLENRYMYTNLKDCKFSYRLVDLPKPNEQAERENGTGAIPSPDLAPGQKGKLKMTLPAGFFNSDVLTITATDPHGRAIYTWSWPVKRAGAIAEEIVQHDRTSAIKTEDQETSLNAQINGLSFKWDKQTGFLSEIKNNGRQISFTQGPRLAEGSAEFQQLKTSANGESQVVECIYKGDLKKVKWTILPSGWLKLEVMYKAPYQNKFMGISFDYPEEQVTGVRWMGEGPYRVWKNRMKGNTLNVWSKAYNNTITGESWVYPEFKGYHRNFYWATVESKEQDFTIVCPDEEVFLRLFTPEKPRGAGNDNTSPEFPVGNISFMHGINPIGTKFTKPETMGPNSMPNMFLYEKYLTLYFNFNKEEK